LDRSFALPWGKSCSLHLGNWAFKARATIVDRRGAKRGRRCRKTLGVFNALPVSDRWTAGAGYTLQWTAGQAEPGPALTGRSYWAGAAGGGCTPRIYLSPVLRD
jgi:hypothetical protein